MNRKCRRKRFSTACIKQPYSFIYIGIWKEAASNDNFVLQCDNKTVLQDQHLLGTLMHKIHSIFHHLTELHEWVLSMDDNNGEIY